MRGPGWWNVDASLFKRFGIGRTNLELRLEAQNVFNHINLGQPGLEHRRAGEQQPQRRVHHQHGAQRPDAEPAVRVALAVLTR